MEKYVAYLLSSVSKASCTKAGQAIEVSHDQINRLLTNKTWSGKDLFDKAFPSLVAEGGTLTVDDTVIDKPYSKLEANELVGYFYSGRHHGVVKGINLVVLIYTDVKGCSLPVNFRLYDPNDKHSKHKLFQAMLMEVLSWGLRPRYFTADSWYSSLENLKFLKHQEIGFQVGLKGNRIVSTAPNSYTKVEDLEQLPEEGLVTHLKGFGFIKVFRTEYPDGTVRHYGVYEPDPADLESYTAKHFKQLKEQHWQVEQLFRIVKQTCCLGQFFVRKARPVTNHVFCVLRAFQWLTNMARDQIYQSVYHLRETLYLASQRTFIEQFA